MSGARLGSQKVPQLHMGSEGASDNRSSCTVLADNQKGFSGPTGSVGAIGTGLSASDCL